LPDKASLRIMNPLPPLPSVFDVHSLASLKGAVRKDDPQALRAAAQQFEAVFMQMVLKSMRATVPEDGMLENDQTRLYRDLLDQQLAQTLSARGGLGLAAIIERQLSRQSEMAEFPDGLPLAPPTGLPGGLPLERRFHMPPAQSAPRSFPIEGTAATQPGTAQPGLPRPRTEGQAQGFVADMLPHAARASAATGIPAHFLIAHAALESGWGRSEPRHADGRPSHNLFGIKAGGRWEGPVVEASTIEYINGTPERRVERFRAYASYAEAFEDYARLLTHSPRYAAVLGSQDAAGFAKALQRSGYATDPAYAAKLESVINGPTLRAALLG